LYDVMTQAQQHEQLAGNASNKILKGPEPAWMDDIRCATKAIESARRRSRANRLDILASNPKSVDLPRD